jgi:SAM-dependent methyltransferase
VTSPARLPAAILLRVGGPLLRARGNGDAAFLDPSRRSHADAMSTLADKHWEELIARFGLKGAGRVLDVACGSGDWLAALARSNTVVVGTDLDEGMLALARRRCAADNVELRAMPAESLDFADGSFDAVTCFSALPYLRYDDAISEMARVLRPGGRLAIGTVGAGYYAKHVAEGVRHDDADAVIYGLDPIMVGIARTVGGDRIAPSSLRSWSPRAVRRLLERHGFAVQQTLNDVDAVNPQWPRRFMARPMYFVVFATRAEAVGMSA